MEDLFPGITDITTVTIEDSGPSVSIGIILYVVPALQPGKTKWDCLRKTQDYISQCISVNENITPIRCLAGGKKGFSSIFTVFIDK